MAEHVQNDCGKIYLRCKLGCGLRVCRGDMKEHESISCPKRTVYCPDCNEGMWLDELEEHRKSQCPLAPCECSLGCGEKGLNISSEKQHRIQSCVMRLVKCECGLEVPYKYYSDHIVTDCTKKR